MSSPTISGTMSGSTLIPAPWYHVLPKYALVTYLVYDEEGVLIYVGVTQNPRDRLRHHARCLPGAATYSYERMPSRAAAEQREQEIILAQAPMHNVAQGTGRFGS